MTIERRSSQLTEGQVPFAGELNQPPDRAPGAAHPPPDSPLVLTGGEIDIVDIAKLEEERRERRRIQKREARRRWRQDYPDAAYQQKQQWRQKPEVKARAAEYARAYRQRKKEERLSAVDNQLVGG